MMTDVHVSFSIINYLDIKKISRLGCGNETDGTRKIWFIQML